MFKLRVIWLLVILALAKTSWAQADIRAFETSLKGKRLQLRNYSADSVAHYAWINGKLTDEPAKVHTFGTFTTRSVTLKKDGIVVEGERATIVRDMKTDRIWQTGKTPMRLEVDLHGADSAQVFPKLKAMIFFPDVTIAAARLPELVSDTLPFDTSRRTNETRDYERVFSDGRWVRLNRKFARIAPPTLVSSVAPELSEEAQRAKVGGSVTLMFYVSETGRVGDIWLAKSLGFGLDERAADAVRQYVFRPGQYDGRPVGTVMSMDVSYQTF